MVSVKVLTIRDAAKDEPKENDQIDGYHLLFFDKALFTGVGVELVPASTSYAMFC